MAPTRETKERFERAYARWEQVIRDPRVQLSSRPQDYIDNEPYQEMTRLGRDALPLVLEKIEQGVFFMNEAALELAGVTLQTLADREQQLPHAQRLAFAASGIPQFPSENDKSQLILKHLRTP